MAFSIDIGNLQAHLGLDSSEFESKVRRAERSMINFGKRLSSIGRNMTMRLTLPLVGFATAAAKSFASFDDAMAKSLAIFGDVSAGMRSQMEQTARTISLRSRSSATELAKAYFYLGSAGFSAMQSLKALSAVEEFATAGTFDLSTATTLAADAQKALGMASANAEVNLANMRHVTDVLAGANTLANATISQFASALTNEAGAAMKVWNIQIEEGVAVLAAYADQGIKAEEAGSAFGRMLRLMSQGFQSNQSAWKALSLSLYDVQGQLRPLADVIEDMTKVLKPMTDQQRQATLAMLGFQARSQQVILPLIGMADAIREYETKLRDMAGITKRLAEDNLKSFGAQLRITWHYIQNFAQTIGRILAPYINRLGNVIRRAHDAFQSLDETVQKDIVRWGMYAAALGPAVFLTGKMVSGVGFMALGFSALAGPLKAVQGIFLTMAVPLGAVIASVGLLAAAAYTVRAAWIQGAGGIKDNLVVLADVFRATWEYISNVVGKFFGWFVETARAAWESAKRDFGNFAKDLVGTYRGIRALIQGEDFFQAFTEGWEEAERQMKRFKGVVIDTFDATKTYAKAWSEAFAENVSELTGALKKQFGEDAAAAIDIIKKKFVELQKSMEDVAGVQAIDLSAMEQARRQAERLQASLDEITDGLKRQGTEGAYAWDSWSEHIENAKNLSRNFEQVAIQAFDSTANALTELATKGKMDIKELAASILSDLVNALIRAQMAAALTGLGGLFGGGFAGPIFGGPILGKGGVLSLGRIVPMQHGGILSSPALIPMANQQTALVAEERPEAVMPLSRDSSGRLGVRSEQPTVVNNTKVVNVWDRDEIVAAMRNNAGEQVILNVLKRHGLL